MSDIERGDPSHSGGGNVKSGKQGSQDEEKNLLELHKAALSNDWEKAETIYKNAKIKYGEKITSRGETALHVAALSGHLEFVKNLVKNMNAEEIAIRSKSVTPESEGRTAFHCAVTSGNVKIAEAIMKQGDVYRNVVAIWPIYMAAEKGNDGMVRFLFDLYYRRTLKAGKFQKDDIRALFLSLIKSSIYDVALVMAEDILPRTTAAEQLEEDGLHELAQIPLKPPGFLDKCIHMFSPTHAVGMDKNAVKLVELLWNSLTKNKNRAATFVKSPDPNPIIEAAKRGNFHYLSILFSIFPDALLTCDRNNYTIIHHAILNRHVDIFNFIHLGPARAVLSTGVDREGNNMLHLAAKLAPPDRLNIVPGAALQLQRELLWFEEAKKVMEPHQRNQKIYYSSDFPVDKMSILIQELIGAMYQMSFTEGIFEKLKQLFERQRKELRAYVPVHQILPKSELRSKYILVRDPTRKMNITMYQSDLLLLFKKLKMVMEQESHELEHYTQLLDMLDLFQEISKEIDQSDDNGRLMEKVKALMRQYNYLRDYSRQLQLWDWYQEINQLAHQYRTDLDNSDLFKEVQVKTLLMKYSDCPLKCGTGFNEAEYLFKAMNDAMVQFHERMTLDGFERNKTMPVVEGFVKYVEDVNYSTPRRTHTLDTMLQLFKETDNLVNQYESNQKDADFIVKGLKDRMNNHSWKKYIFNKKVTDLLQEMNKVMEQHEQKQNNVTKEYTPYDVFVKEHTELMAEGEKWMRDTANSCIIVAVLITTIAFAAVITVPGGNADDGYPIFSSEILFKAFAIADSISMISSSISLLNFLSILTARYTIDDFRWSLPNKLFVGLLTIFISIVAMMLAFVLSIFIVFKNISPLFSILIAATSALPIALFMWQHSGLFLDVFGSTYASYFLFKTRNDPSLVFRRTSSFGVEHKKNV